MSKLLSLSLLLSRPSPSYPSSSASLARSPSALPLCSLLPPQLLPAPLSLHRSHLCLFLSSALPCAQLWIMKFSVALQQFSDALQAKTPHTHSSHVCTRVRGKACVHSIGYSHLGFCSCWMCVHMCVIMTECVFVCRDLAHALLCIQFVCDGFI